VQSQQLPLVRELHAIGHAGELRAEWPGRGELVGGIATRTSDIDAIALEFRPDLGTAIRDARRSPSSPPGSGRHGPCLEIRERDRRSARG